MNYYKRHVGDYLRDAAHLSLLEHGVYTRLLDLYYVREQPIPADAAARLIGARSPDEVAAVDAVLREFFTLVDGAWSQRRCDREIAESQAKAERNREVGQRGGRPKRLAPQTEPIGNPDGFQPEPEANPSHKPIANSSVPDGTGAAAPPPTGSPPTGTAPTSGTPPPGLAPSAGGWPPTAGTAIPAAPPDPVKALFDAGVALLRDSGHPERSARELVGRWRKAAPDDQVLGAIQRCRALSITDPVSWLNAALAPRAFARRPSALDLVANPDYETPL